jgi:nitrile hydratase
MERNVLNRGLASADELSAGHALHPPKALKRKLTLDVVQRGLTRGAYGRPPPAPARFAPGDRVRAKNIHPGTHTRLPRYARGHIGVVERVQGCHVFPDTAALDQGENPQWLYTVVFDGRELWGDDADPTLKISVEAFEPYLETA